MEETHAVILDIGSDTIKAGTTMSPEPSAIIPNVVGLPRRRFMHNHPEGARYVGDGAMDLVDQLTLRYPVDHGHIDNWQELDEVMNYVLNGVLKMDMEQTPTLLTVPPNSSQNHRDQLLECLFEVYNVPTVSVELQALLSLYSTGRTTGVVVEVGEGVTQIISVFEGHAPKQCMIRSDFGGGEITMYLQKLLCDRSYPLTSRMEKAHVRYMKETYCYVSTNPQGDSMLPLPESEYVLPDGQTLRDGSTTSVSLGKEKIYAPEALFRPSLMLRDNPPLVQLVWDSVKAASMDLTKPLLSNVVLAGGSTMFPNFAERLEQDLKSTAAQGAASIIRCVSPDDKLTMAFNGAQTVAHPNYRAPHITKWMTAEMYQEEGSRDFFNYVGGGVSNR